MTDSTAPPAATPPRYGFRPGSVRHTTYADGTTVPALRVAVLRDGAEVGYCHVHLHRHSRGLSFGFTGVAYDDRDGEGA